MNPLPPNDGLPPPPPAPSPREELEARLTAMVLGEAGEFEAETLRARLKADPELAALHRRIEAAARAFDHTFEEERTATALPKLEGVPEHLSPDRAARLAKLFAEAAPTTAQFAQSQSRKPIHFDFRALVRHRRNGLLAIAASLLLLLTVSSLIIPSFSKVRQQSRMKMALNEARIAESRTSAPASIEELPQLTPARPPAPSLPPDYKIASDIPESQNYKSFNVLSAADLAQSVADNAPEANNAAANSALGQAANWSAPVVNSQQTQNSATVAQSPLGNNGLPSQAGGGVDQNLSQSNQGGNFLFDANILNANIGGVGGNGNGGVVITAGKPSEAGANFRNDSQLTVQQLAQQWSADLPVGNNAPLGGIAGAKDVGYAGAVAANNWAQTDSAAAAAWLNTLPNNAPTNNPTNLRSLGNAFQLGNNGVQNTAVSAAAPASAGANTDELFVPTDVTATLVGNLSALGTGSLTLNGGKVDAASGAALPRSNNILETDSTLTLGGGGALTKIGGGALTLTGTNSNSTGDTTIMQGNLQVGNGTSNGFASSIGAGAPIADNGDLKFNEPLSSAAPNIVLNGGNLTFNEGSAPAGGEVLVGGNNLGRNGSRPAQAGPSGAVANNGGLVLTGTNTFAGGSSIPTNGTGVLTTNLGNMTRSPGGTFLAAGGGVVLAGANTFTGSTTLSAGTLVMGNAGLLQNNPLNNNTGDGNLSFGGLSSATLGGVGGNRDLNISNRSASATYTGNFTGNGTQVKGGEGNFTLAVGNNPGNNLGSGNLVLFNGGLQWAGGTETDISKNMNFGGISHDDTFDTNGNRGIPASSLTIYSNLTGGGGLVKADSGVLTLAVPNQFTGNNTITGGNLTLFVGGDTRNEGDGAAQQIPLSALAGGGLGDNPNFVWSNQPIGRSGANAGANQNNEPDLSINQAAPLTTAGAGTLYFNEPSAAVYSGILSGSGTMVKAGSGTLATAESYSGVAPTDVVLFPAQAGKKITNEALPPGAAQQFSLGTPADALRGVIGYDDTSDSEMLPPPAATPAAPAAAAAKVALAADVPVERPASEVKFPPPVATADNAFSTFALNVSDAAYQLARAALLNRRWPDPASTRTEEFLNAFNYHDPAPGPGEAAAFNYDLGQNPIESAGNLLRVSFATAATGRDRATPLRLTILLDGSGSMTRADRVATLQAAIGALGALLRAGDTVSLVTFARTPQVRAQNIPAERFGEIVKIINELQPDGGTNMGEALKTAYAIARASFDLGAQNRVILLTDGAANLGELDPQALAGIVEENRKAGIALDAYGVGWDGFDDTTLEALTRKSDGRYAFLNGPADVNAAFAQKLAGALAPAAQDVKLQIEFNPARVTSYRLMGYNNLRLTKEQFRDNTVSAGELAAAEQGTALYNLALNPLGSGPIGLARARYRDPGTENYHELTWTIQYSGLPPAFDQAPPALRLAAVAAYFAEYLQESPFAAEASPRRLMDLLRGVPEAFAPDPRPANLASTLAAASALGGK